MDHKGSEWCQEHGIFKLFICPTYGHPFIEYSFFTLILSYLHTPFPPSHQEKTKRALSYCQRLLVHIKNVVSKESSKALSSYAPPSNGDQVPPPTDTISPPSSTSRGTITSSRYCETKSEELVRLPVAPHVPNSWFRIRSTSWSSGRY